MLDDGIYTLAYFHKDSVTSCKEIKKDCDEKDCDNWKISAYNKMNSVVI